MEDCETAVSFGRVRRPVLPGGFGRGAAGPPVGVALGDLPVRLRELVAQHLTAARRAPRVVPVGQPVVEGAEAAGARVGGGAQVLPRGVEDGAVRGRELVDRMERRRCRWGNLVGRRRDGGRELHVAAQGLRGFALHPLEGLGQPRGPQSRRREGLLLRGLAVGVPQLPPRLLNILRGGEERRRRLVQRAFDGETHGARAVAGGGGRQLPARGGGGWTGSCGVSAPAGRVSTVGGRSGRVLGGGVVESVLLLQ